MKKIIAYFRDGKFEELLGCVAIVVVIVPVIINIVNRSILNFYSIGLEVTALLAYVWIGYGFFGYMYKKDAHVEMKFVVNKIPVNVRAVFDVLRDVLICAFSVYMVYWGLKLCKTNITRYVTGTKISLALGYASVVFGFFSGAVRSLWAIVGRFIRKKKKGEMTA